ncbi:MAG: host attachment protein [Candidatus Nomurabacteria bacterium]|nr:MAG: host attachment protein [Candidatus Nomurabacteria bacterium]
MIQNQEAGLFLFFKIGECYDIATMHISLNLPQFRRQRALFIVTDKEHAKFFEVSNGEINELEEMAIHPDPSEGRLASGGRRKKIPRKGRLVKSPLGQEGLYYQFAKKVSQGGLALEKKRPYKAIYLFAPHHYRHELLDRLHAYVTKKIAHVIDGDYIHEHPVELLHRVRSIAKLDGV